VIIGAGLAGLTCAWAASAKGKRIRLISKGWGALYWNSGCIDLLGYYPLGQDSPVECPADAIVDLIHSQPLHPYALAGVENIADALSAFQSLCSQENYPLHGSLDQNWLLPTALGSIRPTCLAPETMIAGDLHKNDPILIIGFDGFPDFYPQLIADNLQTQGIPANGIRLGLPVLRQHRFVNSRLLATLFEDPEFRSQIVAAIKAIKMSPSPARIGFPAVLGLVNPLQILQDLEDQLELPVFEIPTLPPSVPGMRVSKILIDATERAGGHIHDGMEAVAADVDNSRLRVVWSEAAARRKPNRARYYILATGGILGGGLFAEYEGQLREVVCDLPIQAPQDRREWFEPKFLSQLPHPMFQSGISVDHNLQPVSSNGQVIYNNLYAIGTGLSGSDFLRERSFNGVALTTGYMIGNRL
jgi:glycerol-3-phosphate dehydrogenase subunit B